MLGRSLGCWIAQKNKKAGDRVKAYISRYSLEYKIAFLNQEEQKDFQGPGCGTNDQFHRLDEEERLIEQLDLGVIVSKEGNKQAVADGKTE